MNEPFRNTWTYFEGEVSIDGVVVQNVGVRKKGLLGSQSETRPSLKIKFDEYIVGQRFSGLERMTLNNNRQDGSSVRTCLSYEVFAAAGIPTPRCNYAHVTVNGENLGIYSHVESIKKRFLRRFFDDDEGDLWEGTVSDFRTGWHANFEQKTNKEVVASKARIEALTQILEADGPNLVADAGEIIDLDAFYLFWATEVLTDHWDGYSGNTNNFFFYDDPTTARMHFLPWGTDATFLDNQQGQPESVAAVSLLTRRLYERPESRAAYLAQLQSLLDDVWDAESSIARVDEVRELIVNDLNAEQMPNFEGGIAQVRDRMSTIDARIRGELEIGGVEWNLPLRGEFCIPPAGSVFAEMESTWGTHPAQDAFMTGTSSLAVIVGGNQALSAPGGASAGEGVNAGFDAGEAVFLGIAPVGDGTFGIVYILIHPENFTVPGALEFDMIATRGFIFQTEPGGGITPRYQLVGGQILFEEGSQAIGAPTRVTVQAQLLPL